MAMTLPKQEGKKIVTIGSWQCHCRNRGKKFCGNGGNVIAENGREKKIVVAEIWGGVKKNVLRLQYFYNIFTTNYRLLVIISSNLNLILRLLF